MSGGSVPASKNPLAVIFQTARQDGFRSIYTGCSTLILGTAFKASVRFLSFDAIKNLLADSNGKLSPGRGIMAGMAAGVVESVVAVTPTERIKTALYVPTTPPFFIIASRLNVVFFPASTTQDQQRGVTMAAHTRCGQ